MFKWLKLENRIGDLEVRCATLEKALKDIDLEWTDTYERFRLLNLRIAKRVQQAEKLELREAEAPTTEGESAAASSTLSPRAGHFQSAILRRRSLFSRK